MSPSKNDNADAGSSRRSNGYQHSAIELRHRESSIPMSKTFGLNGQTNCTAGACWRGLRGVCEGMTNRLSKGRRGSVLMKEPSILEAETGPALDTPDFDHLQAWPDAPTDRASWEFFSL